MMSLSELTASIQREDPWAPSTADTHTHSDASDLQQSANIDAFGSQPFTSDPGNNQSMTISMTVCVKIDCPLV